MDGFDFLCGRNNSGRALRERVGEIFFTIVVWLMFGFINVVDGVKDSRVVKWLAAPI